jgi:UDP-N-acetylmuramate-alanine ligase
MPVELVKPTADVSPAAPAAPATASETKVEATPAPNGQAVPATSQAVDVVAPKIVAQVPEKYELKLPEKAVISDKEFVAVSALAKELGITTNEAAQKLLNFRNDAAAADRAAILASHEAQTVKWMDDVKAEHGKEFEATVEAARRFVAKFGDDKIKSIFNDHGFGNQPDLVRMLAKAGKTMAEGRILSGDPAGEKPKGPKSLADALYPTPSATGTR